ncbi:TadE/TadG family type IV pilus assembly protein [Novosphingobium sp. PP1Y]|uniref:TadE/TadG family type IV pilus assembly protein n=1 Tax=Novosphingobium sp. PP1Y TaxID=702113 RepID=UPI00030112C4|nr:TadE/TadG family type IV pilus assembly protein [Novosphingobium sp. PP1Y]
MFRRIRCLMKSLLSARSGNAMMMVALGMPALIGAMGYGVDTAQWYMWQRELQHSVDQAAIGGAWALAYSDDADYKTRAKQEFNANQKITASFASAPTISLANFDGGTANSVLVTATATKKLPFTGLLLNQSATVMARAQARFKEGSKFHACLITLKQDGTTFQIGGNAHVIANCGLGALSCSDDAITIDGSATVETTSIAACGTVDVPESLQGTVTENASGLTDVYSDIPIPEPDSGTADQTKKKYCEGNGNKAIANLFPGKYVGGYTAKCATTFNSGIYFIDGGTLDLSTNATVVGKNVLFVLRKGAQIKLGGEGATGSITLTPMQAADFQSTPYAADADRLSQMLFMEDKTDETEPASHQINGNTNLNIEGVLYLPNGDVQINGDSGTTSKLCFQISAYTLDIRGSAYLRTLCDYDDSSLLGTSTPIVRLVA